MTRLSTIIGHAGIYLCLFALACLGMHVAMAVIQGTTP